MSTGKLAWLGFLGKWDLGWIVLLGLIVVVESYVLLRVDFDNFTRRDTAWLRIMDKIWYVLIPGGVILLLLGENGVITVPEILERLHPVRTGIGILIMELFYLKHYGVQKTTMTAENRKR